MSGYPTMFSEASELGAYELARQWGGVPLFGGGATALNELAIMAALLDWLRRWLPTQINRAALQGFTLDQIVAATDSTPAQMRDAWSAWAVEQRRLYDRQAPGEYRIGLSPEKYATAAAVLGVQPAPAATELPHRKPDDADAPEQVACPFEPCPYVEHISKVDPDASVSQLLTHIHERHAERLHELPVLLARLERGEGW